MVPLYGQSWGTSSGADFPHLEPTQLRQKAIGVAVVHLKSRAESCPASSTFVCWVHLLGTDCVLEPQGYRDVEMKFYL